MSLPTVSSSSPSLPPFTQPAANEEVPTLRSARSDAAALATAAPEASAVARIAPRPLADPTTLAGLRDCVEDARAAALAGGNGPPDPATYAALVQRLEQALPRLPEAYRKGVGEPLLETLRQLGPDGYRHVLRADPDLTGPGRLLLDVSQAVLQHAEGYKPKATGAFQEVVSDLYDGFLASESSAGVKAPEGGVLPPLVRWGSADSGPYTWPVTDTRKVDAKAPIVSLPVANASGGLLAWPALAHETVGHDILAADKGLKKELATDVRKALIDARLDPAIADYWASRIDETASDVMGVLNMGPAAAVGLIGYFRGVLGAVSGSPRLRTEGSSGDPHPADLLRAYVAAETVRQLEFKGAGRWADKLVTEADKDLDTIRLGDLRITAGVAKLSAQIVARTIVQSRLKALEGRSLGQIQNWSDQDEAVVAGLRARMQPGAAGGAAQWAEGAYAAHAVAAGVYEAVAQPGRVAEAMARTIALLDQMHAKNPSWTIQERRAG
ncbi:MAG: hypothetical protein QM767_24825 [Anaeromyxobacter sp.]